MATKQTRLFRHTRTLNKARQLLIKAVKCCDDSRACLLLGRLNRICSSRRDSNLAAGMPGKPWVNYTLEQVKADIVAKGL